MATKPELPIIQRTYDFILWLVPLVNRWPRDHKFGLGNRVFGRVYHVLLCGEEAPT